MEDYRLEFYRTDTQIAEDVERIARKIEKDYRYSDKELVLVGVLKGSFIFLSDLSRQIEIPHTIDFISVSSYGEGGDTQGEVKLLLDTSQNLTGKDVILVEDIVDSGNTVLYLSEMFKARHLNSLKVCTYVKRNNPDLIDIVDYYGCEASTDKWLVGYGLDYKEQHRSYPYILYMVERNK